ncbi:MAG: DsbA family protein, partial [bacterium]|nr:DsbA family protein [bacterium]
GDRNAPVTMIEFSEYQCPFCARFSTQTLPEIVKTYVDTGKVRVVFRDYPLPFHQNATKAAEAAECAGDQGLFWEMHDLLFANPEKLAPQDLTGYAEQLGLYMPDFTFCMESGKNAAEVAGDLQDGKKAGVNSTPSFFIGVTGPEDKIEGTFIKGAKPFEAFKVAIEKALDEAAKAQRP